MTLRKQVAEIDATLCDQIVDKWNYRKMIYQELKDIKARLDKLEGADAPDGSNPLDVYFKDSMEALDKL